MERPPNDPHGYIALGQLIGFLLWFGLAIVIANVVEFVVLGT